MRTLLILLMLLFAPTLSAYHIFVKNDSPFPILKVYLYTPTTFNNILQTPIAPGEQRLVVPGYTSGTFGFLINAGPIEKDWIDFEFETLDYIFHFDPPLDWYERKIHRHHENPSGCSANAELNFSYALATVVVLVVAVWVVSQYRR